MKPSESEPAFNWVEKVGEANAVLTSVILLRRQSTVTVMDVLACEDLEVLLLTFGQTEVFVLCREETAELGISLDPPGWDAPVRLDLSSRPPWDRAIGLHLYDVWTGTNSKLFQDLVQFSFGRYDKGEQVRIQLEATGVGFQTLVVSEVEGARLE